jgi:hypothetical protein
VAVWGASLGGLDSIRFGNGLILRLWFDRSIDRGVRWLVVQPIIVWLWRRSSSSSDGRLALVRSSSSGDGRLVLAMVV